jgi:two-component system response regulator YesN
VFDAEQINEAAFSYYARLQRVRDYVEEHYTERLSLAEAAQVAGLSETYFSSFFHEKVGVCFTAWVTHFRVQQAIALIETQNISITEVAHSVGFRDLRTFERAFRRHMGMTPVAYKRSVRPS